VRPPVERHPIPEVFNPPGEPIHGIGPKPNIDSAGELKSTEIFASPMPSWKAKKLGETYSTLGKQKCKIPGAQQNATLMQAPDGLLAFPLRQVTE
jgi:hypothetical protein